MAMDPMQLIQQLMAQQSQPPIPGPRMQGQMPPETAMPNAESVAPSAGEMPPGEPGGARTDEQMLDTVHNAMGKPSGGPPPGSGMKWENLEEDQNALEQDPSPENIAAFIQYWGEENLPTNISAESGQAENSQADSGADSQGDY
jgi:hypothetical protein